MLCRATLFILGAQLAEAQQDLQPLEIEPIVPVEMELEPLKLEPLTPVTPDPTTTFGENFGNLLKSLQGTMASGQNTVQGALTLGERCASAKCLCARFSNETERAECESIIGEYQPQCQDYILAEKHSCKRNCEFPRLQLETENKLRELSLVAAERAAASTKPPSEEEREQIEEELAFLKSELENLDTRISDERANLAAIGGAKPTRMIQLYQNQETGALVEHAGDFFEPQPPLVFVGSMPADGSERAEQDLARIFNARIERIEQRQATVSENISELERRLNQLADSASNRAERIDMWLKEARVFWSVSEDPLRAPHMMETGATRNLNCAPKTYEMAFKNCVSNCEMLQCTDACGADSQCRDNCFAKQVILPVVDISSCRVLTPGVSLRAQFRLAQFTDPDSEGLALTPAGQCTAEFNLVFP